MFARCLTICLTICSMTVYDSYAALSLQSNPGLMRYHKGDDVTFIWTFTDKLERIFTIEITYNTDIIVKRLISGQVIIGEKYKDRVTFEELDKSIKLILKDVSDDDVIYGVYKLSFVFVVGGTSSSLNDNKAELYLFGKPTKPVLSGGQRVKEGQYITLMCISSSTSIPIKYQLPLRYTWTRDNINLTTTSSSRHRVNSHQLTITNVMRDDRNHQYTCITGEDGGLSSESDITQIIVLCKYVYLFLSST
ncbi:hypothetical protein LSH36_745g02037, partial [Paralvinella palmiformis]